MEGLAFAQASPASPETALFIVVGLVSVAAFYFGYLAYSRGGSEAESSMWTYGIVGTGVLAAYGAYTTFSTIGAVPVVPRAGEGIALLFVALFFMLMFKEGAEFFE